MYTLFLAYLFLIYLSISTCFDDCVPIIRRNNRVYATLGNCYSAWMTVLYAGWNETVHSTLHTRQSSKQNNKYQVSHKHSCFSWWWAHSRPIYVEIDKYTKNKDTKNKLCTKLALFTRLYRDARSTKHKILRGSYQCFLGNLPSPTSW